MEISGDRAIECRKNLCDNDDFELGMFTQTSTEKGCKLISANLRLD